MTTVSLKQRATNIIRAAGVAMLLVLSPIVVFAQNPISTPLPSGGELSNIDAYAKVFGAVLTGLGTLFGLPIVILNFKKTLAEIRKLELEAASLQAQAVVAGDVEGGTSISISNSAHVNVQVLADPRFLGPLLLLLDFIFAWIVLSFAGHFPSLFSLKLGLLPRLIQVLLAAFLLLPITKEARRVRSVLRTMAQQDSTSLKSNGTGNGQAPNSGLHQSDEVSRV